MYDTIVAISTPIGMGAIGAVRVSGGDVDKIIRNCLKKHKYESKKCIMDGCMMKIVQLMR